MSERSDPNDFASEREEEMRADALGEVSRRLALQAEHPSATHCRICEEPIPEARREHVPGVQTCKDCQEDIEAALAMRGL